MLHERILVLVQYVTNVIAGVSDVLKDSIVHTDHTFYQAKSRQIIQPFGPCQP